MSSWVLIYIILFIIAWFGPLVLGLNLAKRKGVSRNWLWFSVHPFLSWIGYLVVARKELKVQCPECYSDIHPKARICPFCTSDLSESQQPEDLPNSTLHTTLALALGPLTWTIVILVFSASISSTFENSWAYGEAWNRIEESTESEHFLGGTIEKNGFMSGHSSSNRTSLRFGVEGAEGAGKVIIGAHREFNSWRMDTLWIIDTFNYDTLDLSDPK